MKRNVWKQLGLAGLVGLFAFVTPSSLSAEAIRPPTTCEIFIPWDGEGSDIAGGVYDNTPMRVVGTAGISDTEVYKIMMFNKDCITDIDRYNYYNKNDINIFFRIQYGDMTVYAPMPAGYDDDPWSGYGTNFSGIYENVNWSGSSGVHWPAGVTMNSLTCSLENVNWSTLTPLAVGEGEVACNPDELVSPANTNAPTSGTSKGGGEWRYIGYTSNGDAVANTYFPVSEAQNPDLNQYNYTSRPWALDLDDIRIPSETEFDTGSGQLKKRTAVDKIRAQEGISLSTAQMIKNLSLRNNPTIDSAVFQAIRMTDDTNTAVAGYMALVQEAEPGMLRNLMLSTLKLVDADTDEVYVTFERTEALTYRSEATITYNLGEGGTARRLMGGKRYCLLSTVQNMAEVPMISSLHEMDFRINGKIDIAVYEGDDFRADPHTDEYGNEYVSGSFRRVGLKLGSGKSDEQRFCFVLDEDNDSLSVETILGDGYGERGDDLFDVDNDAYLEIGVTQPPKGDLEACDIKLFEAATNKEVKYPRRGVSYYLKYEICYTGLSSQGEKLDLYISSNRGNGAINTDLESGSSYWVQSDTFTNNSTKIDANFKLEDPQYEWEINQNKKNDTLTKVFESDINLTVTSLKASPDEISQSGNRTITLTTTFTMSTPPGVNDTEKICIQWHFQGNTWNTCGYDATPGVINQAQTTVTGSFNIDSFSREIVGVYINPEFPAENHVPETTMTDNAAITYINNTGVKETCSLSNYINSAEKTFFGTKQFKEEYDEVVPEVVDTLEIEEWVRKRVALKPDGTHYNPSDVRSCRNREKDQWGLTTEDCEVKTIRYEDVIEDVTYVRERDLTPEEYSDRRIVKEGYEISKVEMRSKLTIDLPSETKADSEGWVTVYERTGTGQNDYKTNPLYIKAGYGVETRITTKYTSDIFTIQSAIANLNTSNKWTALTGTRKHYLIQFSNKGFIQSHTINSDVYLHNPDGLVISSVKTSTTAKGFKLTQGTATKTMNFATFKKNISDTWVFETDNEKVSSANGTNEKIGRFFIDENTRDGLYTFNLQTNKITSVLGGDALCDRADIQIKVVGSVYDDIITNVIE